MSDTPSQAAARAWLKAYGVKDIGYRSGEHPALAPLAAAFKVFAEEAIDQALSNALSACDTVSGQIREAGLIKRGWKTGEITDKAQVMCDAVSHVRQAIEAIKEKSGGTV